VNEGVKKSYRLEFEKKKLETGLTGIRRVGRGGWGTEEKKKKNPREGPGRRGAFKALKRGPEAFPSPATTTKPEPLLQMRGRRKKKKTRKGGTTLGRKGRRPDRAAR